MSRVVKITHQHEVKVTYDTRKRLWRLVKEFAWGDIEVPKGFEFDLASIPRIFWRLMAPFELSLAAPLIHDFLYRNKGKYGKKTYTRKDADKFFLEIMKEEGVPWWRRTLAYLAVRTFGRTFGGRW